MVAMGIHGILWQLLLDDPAPLGQLSVPHSDLLQVYHSYIFVMQIAGQLIK